MTRPIITNTLLQVNVQRLLERCVQQFAKSKQYKDDARFLKTCLRYADFVADPRDMYKFMLNKRIGVTSAVFWSVGFCWRWDRHRGLMLARSACRHMQWRSSG